MLGPYFHGGRCNLFFSFVYVSYEYLYHVNRHRATLANLISQRTLAVAILPNLCVFLVLID
jgi:hypothetical protein